MSATSRSVLAALAIGTGTPIHFRPEHFQTSAMRSVFAAVCELHASGVRPDLVLVLDKLEEPTRSVWVDEIARGLLDSAGVETNFPNYARILDRELSEARVRGELPAIVDSLSGTLDADRINASLDVVRNALIPPADGDTPLSTILGAVFNATPLPTVPFGLHGLSNLRVKAGNLCVFGARPGAGKTAMLGTVTLAALRDGWRVLFLSIEMTAEEIGERLLAGFSGLSLDEVAAASNPALARHASRLAALPLTIEDFDPARGPRLSASIEAISAHVRSYVRRHPGERVVVMLDYVQLVRTRERIDKRHELIGHVCRELKALAKAAHVPIISAAQLNRAAEDRDRPQLSDFRESGEIEQNSDQAVLMHRESEQSGDTGLRVAKNRRGPKFSCTVRFIGDRCLFEDDPWTP